jgi:aspartate/methionine/tyrosine aminotransferase
MREAHVALTPGRDFGVAETAHFVRFSTANAMQELQTAMARLRTWLHP